MAKSPNTGIAKRFKGKSGAGAVHAGLLKQPLVAGNSELATALLERGTVKSFDHKARITEQGSSDDDFYFVLCGSVHVLVNGHCVATRLAGTHVGEMAAMDSTAKRSATIEAAEEVVTLRISSSHFLEIASEYVEVWQRLATDLGARLRERSKLLRTRNAQPILFVGSSSEGQSVASVIQKSCKQKVRKLETRIWSDGVFQASDTTIETLMSESQECDFAVLVLTPDDTTSSRGKRKSAPRDNVVYELGLFTGALGRDRTIIVMPSDVDIKIPTDLLGVTTLRYKHAKTAAALQNRLKDAVEAIAQRIRENGPK